MAKGAEDPELAVYRLKWQKIFDALVQILNTKESQLGTLLKERKLLEVRIKTQIRIYDSDVAFLEDRISQIDGELAVPDMLRLLDSAKLDLAVVFRKREALLCKLKLDQAEGDMAVFEEFFDKCSDPQPTRGGEELQQDGNTLEDEVRRLKLGYDKLHSEKESEVSALLTEKKFLWHQYNVMEGNFSTKLRAKDAELQLANEKMSHLLANMERLQASNIEKDEEVARLKSKIEEKDEEVAGLKSKIEEKDNISRKRCEEITRLSHDLEELRKTRSTTEIPTLARCTSKSTASSLGSVDNRKFALQDTVRKEDSVQKFSSAATSGKGGSRSSKRKALDIESSEDATQSSFHPNSRFQD